MDIPNEVVAIDPDNQDIRYKAWVDGEFACLRVDYPNAGVEIRFKDAEDINRLFTELPVTMDRAANFFLDVGESI
jgi:hypothetical protein